MSFQDLGIRWKLLGGFGLLVALLAGVSAVGVLSLGRAGRTAREVRDGSFPNALGLLRIQHLTTRMVGDIEVSVDGGTE